jgi:hypothetical protein
VVKRLTHRNSPHPPRSPSVYPAARGCAVSALAEGASPRHEIRSCNAPCQLSAVQTAAGTSSHHPPHHLHRPADPRVVHIHVRHGPHAPRAERRQQHALRARRCHDRHLVRPLQSDRDRLSAKRDAGACADKLPAEARSVARKSATCVAKASPLIAHQWGATINRSCVLELSVRGPPPTRMHYSACMERAVSRTALTVHPEMIPAVPV